MNWAETEQTGDVIERPARGLCGCLLGCSAADFPDYLNYPGIEMLEWRIDAFARNAQEGWMDAYLKELSRSSRLPVIATNRPEWEMGHFTGPEDVRLRMLSDAAKAGAEWIDLEYETASTHVTHFRRHDSRILVSYHNPVETPSRQALRLRVEKMCKAEPDSLKIATYAQCDEDNLRLLELIPFARREFDIDIVAFCMGPIGKWSRAVSLLLGSPWTYVQLPGQPPAAPGQLMAEEMRSMMKSLTSIVTA